MQNFSGKSIILGIGIGIVLTAFISTIYSTGYEQGMDKDEIIERAKQYGMIFSEDLILEGTDQTNSSEDKQKDKGETAENGADKDSQKAAPESQTTMVPSPTSDQHGNSGQVQSEEKNSSKPSLENNTEEKTAENGAKEDVVISIQPGYTSEVLAKRLFEAGLIRDADSFVNHLVAMKLEGAIQVGDFRIKRGSDYNTIARVVTMTGG